MRPGPLESGHTNDNDFEECRNRNPFFDNRDHEELQNNLPQDLSTTHGSKDVCLLRAVLQNFLRISLCSNVDGFLNWWGMPSRLWIPDQKEKLQHFSLKITSQRQWREMATRSLQSPQRQGKNSSHGGDLFCLIRRKEPPMIRKRDSTKMRLYLKN